MRRFRIAALGLLALALLPAQSTTDDRVTIAGLDVKPFALEGRAYSLTSGLTIRHPVRFGPGASLDLAAGATVTTLGDVTGEPAQRLFSGAGNMAMTGQRSPVHAEWWGARPDSVADSLPAFQAAHDALPAVGTIRPLAGTYSFTPGGALTITKRVHVECQTHATTFRTIDPAHPGYLFRILADYVRIRGCIIGQGYSVAGGIEIDHNGMTELSDLWIVGFDTGLRVVRGNADRFERLRVQACIICIHTGGIRNKQVGDTTWNEIVAIPRHPTGTAWLMDGGTNAQYRSRVETIGGLYGDLIKMSENEQRNTLPPGQQVWSRPANIWCWNCNLDASVGAQARIEAGWQINYVNTNASGSTDGVGIIIDPANPSDVDGVTLANMQIASNRRGGVVWKGGRNLQISGGHIYSNGAAGQYAALEVGANTQGLLQVVGVNMGGGNAQDSGWGNVRAVQSYGIRFDPNALSDSPMVIPDPLALGLTPESNRPPAIGRAIIAYNQLGGNALGTIVGAPKPTGGRLILSPNMVD